MNEPLLRANELTCYRDERLLFENLTFRLFPGQIMQIVGANGVGKTTLLRALTGILPLHAGKVYWKEQPILQARESYYQDIIFISHRFGIKGELTPLENLQFCLGREKYSFATIQQALLLMGLSEYQHTLCRKLSQGQRQRVALASLFYNKASIWLLDEPFASLDEHIMPTLQSLIKNHLAKQRCVIFTSHREVHGFKPLLTLQLGEHFLGQVHE